VNFQKSEKSLDVCHVRIGGSEMRKRNILIVGLIFCLFIIISCGDEEDDYYSVDGIIQEYFDNGSWRQHTIVIGNNIYEINIINNGE